MEPLNPLDGRLNRRTLLQRAALVGGVVLAPGALAACGGSSSSSSASSSGAGSKPKVGGTLRTGHVGGGNVESINPLILPNVIDVARAQQMYELLFFPRPNLTLEPRLAESLTANGDATVWQLKLRSGVTFHDGKPFTADDVLYSWKYTLEPSSKAEGLSYLTPLDMSKTKKVSDTEITVYLKQPVGDLARLLSSRPLYIIPDGMTDFNKPNGTGPFKFVNWTQGVQSTMTANKNYWGPGPYFDQLIMHSIPDQTARLNALLGGQIDAMEQLDFNQAKAQTGNSAIHLLQTTSPGTTPFTMRMDVAPFNDPKVREAFKLAVDRDQMLTTALLGYGSLGNDLFGKGFPSYNDTLAQRKYDPEKAKALLNSAGHSNLSVTLYTANGVIPGLYEAATAFVQQAKPAGINVTLQQLTADAYFDPTQKYMSASAPLYQSYWPESFEQQANDALLDNSPYKGETNWWKSNAAWGKEFRKAQGISDEAQRDARYKELQVPLYNSDGYVVWGFADLVDGLSPKISGAVANPLFPLGYFEFHNWWFGA